MPELPEVETVKRGLLQGVTGKIIVDILVRNPNLRFPVRVDCLKKIVPGGKITDIDRRAKYLLIKLSGNATIIAHLGMSGKFILLNSDEKFDKHDHLIFYLNTGEQLRFRDPRRFGMVDAVPNDDLARYPRLKNLGVEPFTDAFSPEYCAAKCGNSERYIKTCLMDSRIIVGLGNIYVNEALFKAGIMPDRSAKSLNRSEWEKLVPAIKDVLSKAVQQGGTTLQDQGFRNVLGEGGHFQIRLQIYGRAGGNCNRCGNRIERIVQQGRSSFFCRNCQK